MVLRCRLSSDPFCHRGEHIKYQGRFARIDSLIDRPKLLDP
jgi:hypothetical protein